MGFIQIIEYETDRAAEIDALMNTAMEADAGPPPFTRLAHTQDRDNPRRYLTVIEFPSFEEAMANSDKPETAEMAGKLAALCASGPRFHNLNVLTTMP